MNPHTHNDGRVCHVAPFWVGNVRDGHWDVGYWFREPTDPPDAWRWCARHPRREDDPDDDPWDDDPADGAPRDWFG